jgi:hypothetical protein
MPEPPPSGTRASAWAEGSNTADARSRLDTAAKVTITAGLVGQRTLVLKYLSPIDMPPDHSIVGRDRFDGRRMAT